MAQSEVDGAVSGRVVSAEGAAIAGAEIVLDGEQGVQRLATSGRKGEFLMIRLPPGAYRLRARAPGYRGAVEIAVTIELGRTTEVQVGRAVIAPIRKRHKGDGGRIRLVAPSIAGLSGLVGTRAGVSTIQSATPASTGIVLTGRDLERSPIAGNDWNSLALESPVAHADPEADGATLLTLRGLDTTQNSSQIDGLSHDQSFGAVPVGTGASVGLEQEDSSQQTLAGGSSGEGIGHGRHAGAAYTFSQAAVREFRLSEQSYSALYGRAVGGVTTAVSKSGTNALHGTAFLTLRESAWGAANPFSVQTTYADGSIASSVVKPQDQRQQFGGSVGGAVIQNRLFYFAAYDQQRRGFPAISSPAFASFYALTAVQTGLLGTRGVKPAQTNAALDYLSSLTGSVARRQDQTVAFGKTDLRVNGSNHVSAQYNRVRWTSPAGATTAAVVARGRASLGNNDGQVDEVVGRWTAFLGARFSNELRVLYGRDFQYETAQTPLPQEPGIGPGGFAPEINVGPQGLLFGTPASLGRKAYPDERRLEFADTFAWTKGRHLLRIGGEFSAVHDLVDALNNQEGTFSYDSGLTNGHAGGLVDWITDYTFNVHAYPNGACPSINAKIHDFCFRSFSQSFGEQTTSFDTQEWSGFVQDDWRVRPGLTVNLGVRYEYELLPFPQTPNVALDAVFGKIGSTSVFPEDRNNFGPRAGLSWQAGWMHGGVVHAGYGLYFGRLPGLTIRSALVDSALASSTTHVRILPTTETDCPQVANQGFGYACAYVTAPPATIAATTSATVFDRHFRLPAVQQASVSFEHGVGAGITTTASFVMNMDRQLPNSVDLNIAPSTAMGTFQLSGGTGALGVQTGERFVVPVYTSRVTNSLGPVTDIVSNANGTYDGLILEARRRSRGGLDLRVNWTWSKAIDYGQASGGIPRTNGQFDPFALGYDKGLSSLNYPHRFVATAIWTPTVHSETHWLRAAANGWDAAPMLLESSGRAYSYEIFGGSRLTGGYESINGSGGATYLPTLGRNTLRLPQSIRVNLRVSRAITLTEHVQMRGVAEIFNVSNRVNYSGVTQRAFLTGTEAAGVTPLIFQDAATVASEGLNVRPFGAFTSAGTSDARERQVQLGLRLEF
ncbi:TonB-dependent receptor [Granulicella arctica]|uniref:TonB-dependent receptor n=1 Tax=Granulicella arctica TaxID=940613 RepID=UPI0021DF69C5|nr:TonB-dependent receptor [Granulicella arctica]